MNPAFRFARAGKVYKELEADEGHLITGFLRTGVIGSNDDYWMPGMTEWKKVFSRDWTIAKPASSVSAPAPAVQPIGAAKPSPTTKATVDAQATAAASAIPVFRSSHLCECTSCKGGFSTPAKAVSGYSVIGKAALFFISGVGLMILTYAMKDMIMELSFDPTSRFPQKLSLFIVGLVTLAALCFFLMALFELIAAAVTHGIYRANPERCPFCTSSTFTKKA
jgi:hypothetical protein